MKTCISGCALNAPYISSLTLARLTLRVLEQVLGLLGIEVPERM